MKRCGSKLGIDATKQLPGEGFKHPWPPPTEMDEAVKARVEGIYASFSPVENRKA